MSRPAASHTAGGTKKPVLNQKKTLVFEDFKPSSYITLYQRAVYPTRNCIHYFTVFFNNTKVYQQKWPLPQKFILVLQNIKEALTPGAEHTGQPSEYKNEH